MINLFPFCKYFFSGATDFKYVYTSMHIKLLPQIELKIYCPYRVTIWQLFSGHKSLKKATFQRKQQKKTAVAILGRHTYTPLGNDL